MKIVAVVAWHKRRQANYKWLIEKTLGRARGRCNESTQVIRSLRKEEKFHADVVAAIEALIASNEGREH